MVRRIASAAVGIPLLSVVIWVGFPWLTLVVAAVAGVGALEICRMARKRGFRPAGLLAAGWAAVLAAGTQLMVSGFGVETTVPALVGFVALATLILVLNRARPGSQLATWTIGMGASLYIGGLLSYAPVLRDMEQGMQWVFLAVLATFAADTSALFVGMSIGRRQLAPTVSPGKTWEGAAGGLVGGVGAGVASTMALGLRLSLGNAMVLGGLLGVFGQIGDLAESSLKRAARVKDSGWLIPGHGGVVDRLDSIVFNLALVYHFVIWTVQ